MIVTCNDKYWEFMQASKPEGAPCGRTYNDVDHSTICPHEKFLSEAETQQRIEQACGELGHKLIDMGKGEYWCLCGKIRQLREKANGGHE
jgi:hypothetical protein